MQSSKTTAERAPVRGGGRAIYAALIITLVALTNYRAILPIFRDHLLRYLSINDLQFGQMFSIREWSSLAPLLLVGWLIVRLGARRMLIAGLLIAGAGMATLALCGASWGALTGAMVLATAGCVLMDVASNTFLVQLFPDARRRMLSLCMAARSGTETLVPVLAEGLLRLTKTTPAVTFGAVLHAPFGLLAVIFLVGSLFFRAPGTNHPVETSWRWRDLLISRRSVGLLALIMLHSASDASLFTWMSRFLGSKAFTWHPFPPGFVISAFSIAYIVARLTLAGLPEGWGRRALLVFPGLLGGSVLIAAILSHNYLLMACGYVLGGFLWSTEFPTMLGRIAEQEGDRFGPAMVLVSVVSAIGFATALLIIGQWVEKVGEARMWIPMLALAGGFPLIGLGGALWLTLTERTKDRYTLLG